MSYIGGLYTGLNYTAGLVNEPSQIALLDDYLKTFVDANKVDSVVSVFMMPSDFYDSNKGLSPVVKNVAVSRPTKLDGHTPRNKKLLTYPYMFLCVDSLNDSKNYRFEWGEDPTQMHFALVCGLSPNPEIVCYPRGYNGTQSTGSLETRPNATESVTVSGFPQCAFTIDSFRAWLAQKATGEILGFASSAGVTVASAATGNLLTGAAGAMGMAASVNGMLMEATQGSKSRGSQGTTTDVAWRVKGIYFKTMSVTKEYAEIIDDFLDRYGYATCKVKTPNRNVRPHWTYTKTKNCSIRGSVPTDDMQKIKSIYDKGITFWRNSSEVGNYSLVNSI